MSPPTVSYVNYGPFTSYAPTFDSTFANIGKDDSDLILASFGDESSQQGADRCELTSLEEFLRAAQMFLCLCFTLGFFNLRPR